ncbi:hypothetical protein OAF85_00565 [Planctomycetota bacterium]|nr:hypothetical protein [Planctomycetota bacterium]
MIPETFSYIPTDLDLLGAAVWASSTEEASHALDAIDRILPRLTDSQKSAGIAKVAESLAFDAKCALERLGEGDAPSPDTIDKYPGWRDATRLYDSVGLRWKQLMHQGRTES